MLNTINCPVCQNLCSSQAISCPKCGHPFPKKNEPVPAFLADVEEPEPSQPLFVWIFRILSIISLVIACLFGIMLLIAPFTNPNFKDYAVGIFVKFFLAILSFAFFSFLVSVGKRK